MKAQVDKMVVSAPEKALVTRNRKMDALKGCAIICMVLAHSGFAYTHQIYLFHMAVFFMASGYFFNSKNAASVSAVAKYSWHKVLALYLPYVVFNGAILLLTNVFLKIGILTDDPEFLQVGGEGAAWGLVYPFDRNSLRMCIKGLLRFSFEPQLAGANWFLRALFWVSVLHCLVMWVIRKLPGKVLPDLMSAAVVIGCCLGTVLVNDGALQFLGKYKILFAAYLAFWMGYLVRRYEHWLRYDAFAFLLSAALLYVLDGYGGVNVNIGQISSLPFYIMTALLGWIMLRSVAELASGWLEKILAFVGKYSMAIMFWHFMCFKLVTWLVILLRGDDMILLASFPHLDGASGGLWLVYTVVGVGLPALMGSGYRSVKNKITLRLKKRSV